MVKKISKALDFITEYSLYPLFFCIPFTKAGIESLMPLAITAWFFRKLINYRLNVKSYFSVTPLNKALMAFIIVNLLSLITSVNISLSVRGFFGKTIEHIMLYFVISDTINNRKRLRNMLIIMSFSVVLMIADSAVQYLRGYDFLRHYPVTDSFLRASFSSHNGLGGWIIVIAPVFLCLFLSSNIKNKFQKTGLGAALFFLLICLLLTYSRGAWLGFSASLGFMLLLSSVRYKLLPKYKITAMSLIIICIIGIYFLLPPTMKERIKSIPNIGEGSASTRINTWRESLNIIGDYPLFGTGPNTYSFIGPRYKFFEGGGVYPHNSFLQMSAETGIIGTLSFVWILVILFKLGVRSFIKSREPLLLGLLSGIVAFLVQSFFDTNLYALQLVTLFWFMMGLTVAVMRLDDSSDKITAETVSSKR